MESERPALLDPARDPAPVEVIAATSRPDILLVCEHAGRAVPVRLGDLGVTAEDMERHIAWDIGAELVARALAERIGCTLVLQRYSRLVIDCNRPPRGTGSMPAVSDGTVIGGNEGLSALEEEERVREIFLPFEREVTSRVEAGGITGAFSIHSFTPQLRDGPERPWHIGFCARRGRSAERLARMLSRAEPELVVAVNEPYRIDDETDWFIPRVAEPSGAAHALIEIRNDLIPDADAAATWARRLASILTEQS